MTVKAYIERNFLSDPLAQTVRLHVIQPADSQPWGKPAYLTEDGKWQVAVEGAVATNAGIILPAGAVEAIAQAVQDFLGHSSHADTEARVLREWLAVEKARVDKALEPPLSFLRPE